MGKGGLRFLDANIEGSNACMGGEQIDHPLSHVLHQSNRFGSVEHDLINGDLEVSVVEGLIQVFDAFVAGQGGPHGEDERLWALMFLIVPPVGSHDFVSLETDTPLHGNTSVLFVSLVDPNQVVAELGLHGW